MLRGEIIEITGSLSSGRTSLFTTFLREVTRGGGLAALVDADESFDPVSAARAGVDLSRLLWVRCGRRREVALRAADLLVRCPGLPLIGLDLGETPPRLSLTALFRLKHAVRRAGGALVILCCRRIAGPSARLAVRTVRRSIEWAGPGTTPTRLARVCIELQVLRALNAPLPTVASRLGAGFLWWEA